MFQIPPPTRFDLRFSILGFPVRVHPLFWVIALLLGSGSGNLFYMLLWVIGVFISILIHELGHALAFRRYGQEAEIIRIFSINRGKEQGALKALQRASKRVN
jgi:stage IV sporulation protein FB